MNDLKVGDQIQVQIKGGVYGIIFRDTHGAEVIIKPGSTWSVNGQIQRDLEKYWRVKLSGSLDGINMVHVPKAKKMGGFSWFLNLF
jgi:hypothetical protein